MDFSLILWIFLGCLLGIFTGIAPGIHINTIAAFSTTIGFPNSLGIALMIASMSIVHCFVDFIPSIVFGAPEESSFLAALPGHRMLLHGNGLLAVKLAAIGALFSGIIAIAFSGIFVLFIEKSPAILTAIMPFALLFVLFVMVAGEVGLNKKIWAIIVIALSALLGIILLEEKSIVPNALLACITGFFGASTIIESLRKKSFFPKQRTKGFKIKKSIVFQGSLLGFLAGAIVAIIPSIGSNQAAFILKKFFGKISTARFLVLLGGSNTTNMFLGLMVLFSWGKTRNGSAAAISQLVEMNLQNILLLTSACLIALGFGFLVTMLIAKSVIEKMQKIDYKKINIGLLGILLSLVFVLSGAFGLIAFFSATAIGMVCIFKGVKRTNCMAFLMIPALMYYLGS